MWTKPSFTDLRLGFEVTSTSPTADPFGPGLPGPPSAGRPMHIRILGSAAGGASPVELQLPQLSRVRDGSVAAQPRTQSSIALSDDGERWILCNASPDIRAQIAAFPALQPARRPRDTAIGAIVLLDSQIDHTTGLLSLREGCPHEVWCTQMVHQDLSEGFPLFPMLSHWNGGLRHRPIALDGEPFAIPACPRLRFTAIPCAAARRRTPRIAATPSGRQHRPVRRGPR